MKSKAVAPKVVAPQAAPKQHHPWPPEEPLNLASRLRGLAAILRDLTEPVDRGLTDDLWVSPDTLRFLSQSADELAEQVERVSKNGRGVAPEQPGPEPSDPPTVKKWKKHGVPADVLLAALKKAAGLRQTGQVETNRRGAATEQRGTRKAEP